MFWGNGSTSSGQRNNNRARGERKRQRRAYGRKVTAGAVILGAMLVIIPGTRGTGLMILAVTVLVLYMLARRKRA
jgi:Flp pilus assembly protein TadB